jgi:hypothetical protein
MNPFAHFAFSARGKRKSLADPAKVLRINFSEIVRNLMHPLCAIIARVI